MTVTIAVIDDDVRILDAIELVLAIEGFLVRTYATGEAFLTQLAHDGAPHCIILDPHLPGMNGAEVAHVLGSGGDQIPIIALTARPGSAVTLQVMRKGARVMLTKPVAADELLCQVQAAVKSIGEKQRYT